MEQRPCVRVGAYRYGTNIIPTLYNSCWRAVQGGVDDIQHQKSRHTQSGHLLARKAKVQSIPGDLSLHDFADISKSQTLDIKCKGCEHQPYFLSIQALSTKARFRAGQIIT